MSEDLPTEFDLIVVGTGLSESIIAAAASRVGRKVLHVDSNDYYGGLWASFNFESIQKFIRQCDSSVDDADVPPIHEDGEVVLKTNNSSSAIDDVVEEWYIPENGALISDAVQKGKLTQTKDSEHENDNEHVSDTDDDLRSDNTLDRIQNESWTQEKVKQEYRKFNIDLSPKLLYARGSLVELLISSNIARYAEFRNVSRVLTWVPDLKLQEVPCSRADVFATKQVSVVEKRMLMKLITDIMNEEKDWEPEGAMNKKFVEFLNSYKITPMIVHYVLYTMAGSNKETPFEEGMLRTRKFLQSLGRYGNTPFLWTMYGSGELPQCFCRLCAVFGGTYCLNRTIHSILLKSDGLCSGIIIGNQRISTSKIVMSIDKAPAEYVPKNGQTGAISRAVFIISKSIKDSDKENLTLLRFPPIEGYHPCTVIEVGPATSACPKDLYILHMFTKKQKSAKEDLAPYVEKLLNTQPVNWSVNQSTQTDSHDVREQGDCELPQVLWSLYYSVPDFSQENLRKIVPGNVYLCSGPDFELDFEFAVKQAKEIFSDMYPDDEFLPRAPDPEDIVLEGEECTETNENDQENDTESDLKEILEAEEVQDALEDEVKDIVEGEEVEE